MPGVLQLQSGSCSTHSTPGASRGAGFGWASQGLWVKPLSSQLPKPRLFISVCPWHNTHSSISESRPGSDRSPQSLAFSFSSYTFCPEAHQLAQAQLVRPSRPSWNREEQPVWGTLPVLPAGEPQPHRPLGGISAIHLEAIILAPLLAITPYILSHLQSHT